MSQLEVDKPVIIQELQTEESIKSSVKLFIQREDLRHPYGMGNKWWKLKYNLKAFEHSSHDQILTFGGAYSNHIHALAATCAEQEIPCIGVIRGEEPKNYSPTLKFAVSKGMKLHFVSRSDYRQKAEKGFEQMLKDKLGSAFIIPEGGSNKLAVKGVGEMVDQPNDFDWIVTPVGTGGTLAGIINSLKPNQRALGISSLKGAYGLADDVRKWVKKSPIQINHDYHFGGYAKKDPELESFMMTVKANHKITLDHVYTGKMFYGCIDLIKKNFFKAKSKILMIHTGGLQGNPTTQ